jgi:lipoate-protein ligase A
MREIGVSRIPLSLENVRRMKVFGTLRLWIDPVARPGPEAMAVDEWLMETADAPVLRVYRWLGNWGSIGYFGALDDAMRDLPGLEWLRRWTGGGTVDHRTDWTYTVIAPADEPLARLRGAESYRRLHAALAAALRAEGIDARLSTGAQPSGSLLCFENPVSHDLIDAAGRKLAGAGQRRTRQGLLHQGSLALMNMDPHEARRAERLADCLAIKWDAKAYHPQPELMAHKIAQRYACHAWTQRR